MTTQDYAKLRQAMQEVRNIAFDETLTPTARMQAIRGLSGLILKVTPRD